MPAPLAHPSRWIVGLLALAALLCALLAGTAVAQAAPAPPTLTSPADGDTVDPGSVTFTGEASPNALIRVTDQFSGLVSYGTARINGHFVFDVQVSAGYHRYSLTQTVDDQESAPAGPYDITAVDTAPTIHADGDTSDLEAGDDLAVSGTALPNATLGLYNTDGRQSTVTADGDGHWSGTVTLVAGRNFVAVADDDTGQMSELLLLTAVGPPVIDTPAAGATVGPRFTVSGEGMPDDEVVVTAEDGTVLGRQNADPCGCWSVQTGVALPAGAHTITATQIHAGVTRTSTVAIEVDDNLLTILTPEDGGTFSGPTLHFSGTGAPGATISVLGPHATSDPDASTTATTVVGADHTWGVDFPVPPGTNVDFVVTQSTGGSIELAGYVKVPDPTLQLDSAATVKEGAPIEVSGTGVPGGAIDVLDNGSVVLTTGIDTDGTWSASFPALYWDNYVSARQTSPDDAPASDPTDEIHVTGLGTPVVYSPGDGDTVSTPFAMSGAHVVPGATLTVRDADGHAVATAPTGDTGGWEIDAVDAPGGEQALTVEESLDGVTSDPVALNLTVQQAPTITQQPQAVSAARGQSATFTAAASGYPEPTVQWQRSADGSTWQDIPGATDPTYAFTTSASDANALFRAVFTNSLDTATTDSAQLTLGNGVTRQVCASGCAYTTIGAAIAAADRDDTITIGPGTYNEQLTITKKLTLQGAGATGPDATIVSSATAAITLTGAASGTTITDLAVRGNGPAGSSYGITAVNNAIDGVTLDGVRVSNARWGIDVRSSAAAQGWRLENVTATGNNFGARLWGDSTDWIVLDSHFDGNDFGFYTQYKAASTPGVFANAEIIESTFDGNSTKGLYFESLSGANIEDSTVANTGTISELRPSGTANLPITGIDVNLKYGAFDDVTFDDVAVTGTKGTGMAIKARNDGTYAAHPATLDTLTLVQGTAAGSTTANSAAPGYGVMLGNALTDVDVRGMRIAGNAAGGLLSYVDSGTIAAADNWWGCNTGPNTTGCDTATVTPTTAPLDLPSWIVLTLKSNTPYLQPGGDTATITAALDTNNLGDDVQGAGAPVHFSTTRGSIDPADGYICPCGGPAEATLTSGAELGVATVRVKVDAQRVAIYVQTGGPSVDVSPSTHAFGTLSVGQTSPPATFTVTNVGTDPLHVTSVTRKSPGGTHYQVTADTCSGTEVAPSATCDLTVVFQPKAAGPHPAEIQILSDALVKRFAVTGTALAPDISVAPSSLAFGNVEVGGASPSKRFTVTNSGSAPLVVGAVTRKSPGGTHYELTGDTCSGATVAPSATCTIDVAFRPKTAGRLPAQIQMVSNAPVARFDVDGTGIAAAITAAPAALAFSNTEVGQTSAPQAFTITNTGSAPLLVTGVTRKGSGATHYQVTGDSCTGVSVAPGASCALDVVFKPKEVGRQDAQIQLVGNAPVTRLDVSGTAVAARPVVSPGAVDFGTTVVGHASAPTTVTVANQGDATMVISAVSRKGTGATHFAVVDDRCTGVDVDPGATCTIGVVFKPKASGPQDAQVQLLGNGFVQRLDVTGSGT
jgi:hypothetical protein